MGNLSSKRHVMQSRVRQNAVNNNAYNIRNRKSLNQQFTPIDSSLWSKPKRPSDLRLFEPSIPSQVTEVSDFLGKTTTLVDLSDTSTLTISSDEISSRSSSDTLHPPQPSKLSHPCVDEKQTCRSGCSGAGDKSNAASSDYLNLESLPTPSGCNRFQPQHLSNLLEDNLRGDVLTSHKPPIRKELKPPAQPKNVPPLSASRQPINNFKHIRSLSRQSLTPGLKPRQISNAASESSKPFDRQPQKPPPQSTLRPSPSQSTLSASKPVPSKPSQSLPRHIKQIENHNSQQSHDFHANSSSRSAYPYRNCQSRNSHFMDNSSHLKNVSRSSMSVNFSLNSSPYPRQPRLKGLKNSSNLKPILLSPKDSSQSYVRSCASNPKSSKSSLRCPSIPKSPKVEHVHRPIITHGLRKISDSEYQKYNAIINDFHCQMKARRPIERHESSASNSRSPSLESKISSIDNPKSKAYDETDDESYSFPVSTTHVRPPSQVERSHSTGSFGDLKRGGSSLSNHLKSTSASGRTPRHTSFDHRSTSLPRNSTHSYIVEIRDNIKELQRRAADPKAIFCYKFVVDNGPLMQKMLTDTKDHLIETICRQASCRIHVKRRWLRHSSQPPSYDIIIFARDIKNIEKCCNLFDVMLPSFNAEAGLGY